VNKLRTSAALLFGGILLAPILAPISGAMAQATNVAYAAPAPKAGYVVFLDSGSRLSSTADQTIRMAAEKAKAAGAIRLAGRADNAQAVKRELIRNGVPASAITVEPTSAGPLPYSSDGVSDPSNRAVEIIF
jgi:uncharacterized SAM-binding protein YcdF (DUF218 family)